MEEKKKHIQNLVYFALVDKHFDTSEKDFIRQVGKRLELNDEEINIILDSNPILEPELPTNEVQKYILFDDIFNLISADKIISKEEEIFTKKVAEILGFNSEMVNDIFLRLKRHIELGFDLNQISHSIKNSIFSLNLNKVNYEKYS